MAKLSRCTLVRIWSTVVKLIIILAALLMNNVLDFSLDSLLVLEVDESLNACQLLRNNYRISLIRLHTAYFFSSRDLRVGSELFEGLSYSKVHAI